MNMANKSQTGLFPEASQDMTSQKVPKAIRELENCATCKNQPFTKGLNRKRTSETITQRKHSKEVTKPDQHLKHTYFCLIRMAEYSEVPAGQKSTIILAVRCSICRMSRHFRNWFAPANCPR